MIEKLKELHESATLGEWKIHSALLGHKGDVFSPTAKKVTDCHHIARCFAPKPEKAPVCALQAIGATIDATKVIEANAAIIAFLCSESTRKEIIQRLEQAEVLREALEYVAESPLSGWAIAQGVARNALNQTKLP